MRLTGKEFKEYVVQLSDMPFDEAYNAVDELPIDRKQKHRLLIAISNKENVQKRHWIFYILGVLAYIGIIFATLWITSLFIEIDYIWLFVVNFGVSGVLTFVAFMLMHKIVPSPNKGLIISIMIITIAYIATAAINFIYSGVSNHIVLTIINLVCAAFGVIAGCVSANEEIDAEITKGNVVAITLSAVISAIYVIIAIVSWNLMIALVESGYYALY